MKIEFVKDYKKYKKGDKIEKMGLLAKLLIKNGIACETEEKFKLSDLQCAMLCVVENKSLYKRDFGDREVLDVSFEITPRYFGIFTYQPARYYKGMFNDGDCYEKVLSKENYVSDKYIKNEKIKLNQIIINSSDISSIEELLPEEIEKNGWNKDSLLGLKDIIKLEVSLNFKYEYQLGISRSVGNLKL